MTAVDEIKSRLDIVDIVSETVTLRRAGKNYTGFCPFHSNTRTPAFVVFPETGTWRCFSCNEGGDIFNFVMRKEGWDFQEALKQLARRAGVELEPLTPEVAQRDQHLDRLHQLLEEVVIFFHQYLVQNPAGQQALAYLTRRGLTDDTINQFGLGYAPSSYEATYKHFLEKGYKQNDLLDAGMLSERSDGTGYFDRFRNRVMFPIRDSNGEVAGFGARALAENDNPKYLNSPQSVLFDKSRLLYGLDKARKAIRKEDQVVIVEGYMDVIGLHQAGFSNAVSPMGTALNEYQFKQLKKYTRRIFLALDPDAAGQKATLRGLELARQSLDHSADFVPGTEGIFDSRGLIRYEARLEADLRITTLPEGKDPDEIVMEDPQEWIKILADAKPVVEHVMNMLVSQKNMDDPKVKREIAEQVLPLIEDVPSAVERDAYRQKLARLLRVDERALMTAAPTPARPARRSKSQGSGRSTQVLSRSNEKLAEELETCALRLLIRQPEALHTLDRTLQKATLPSFSIQDFEKTDHQVIMQLIQTSLEQDQLEPVQFIHENLPVSLLTLTGELEKPLGKVEPDFDHLVEELVRIVLRLRYVRIEQGIEQLGIFQQDLAPDDFLSLAAYHEMILNYYKTRERIDLALSRSVQLD
ncbi:MAG: DNA primase [Chloroflexi bacterium]|nr:DNA primase [Chloroflexota bacterium]